MANQKNVRAVDSHVGYRIRSRRNQLDMSQSVLGGKLGVTFQQVQKYEKGHNRVGASRLAQIASILGVHVSYFFEGAPSVDDAASDVDKKLELSRAFADANCTRLAVAYMRISDQKVRVHLANLVEQISKTQLTVAADAGD